MTSKFVICISSCSDRKRLVRRTWPVVASASMRRIGWRALLTMLCLVLLDATGYAENHSFASLSEPSYSTIRFEHYQFDSGLSNESVFAVAQDKHGFLWVGTQDGLNKYDGLEFKTYLPRPGGLSDRYVRSLLVADGGAMWIATEVGGVSRLDTGTESFARFEHDPSDPESMPPGKVYDMAEGDDGSIWIATDAGVRRIVRDTQSVHSLGVAPGVLRSNRIRGISTDSEGDLLIASWGGGAYVTSTDGEVRVSYAHDTADPSSLCSDYVWTIMEDSSGTIWMGTRDGLFEVDSDSSVGTCHRNSPGDSRSLGFNFVKALHEDARGNIWIGTWGGGVSIFDRERRSFVTLANDTSDSSTLASNKVATIFEDAEGLIWVGTSGGGLAKVDPSQQRFRRIEADLIPPGGSGPPVVWSLHEDEANTIWIGTTETLVRFDRETGATISFPSDIPATVAPSFGQSITGITDDGYGSLWISTWGNGLLRFDVPAQRLEAVDQFPEQPIGLGNEAILSMHRGSDGRLWLGTLYAGLQAFEPESGDFEEFLPSSESGTITGVAVTAIYEDRHGVLWVGTQDGGLNRMDPPGRFEALRHRRDDPSSLSSDRITTVFRDTQDRLWVGTTNGLNLIRQADVRPLSNARVTRISEADGLPSGLVQAIVEDEAGNLWVSTSRGVARWNPETAEVRAYSSMSGLAGDSFSAGAGLLLANGDIAFGGVGGASIFTPGEIGQNPFVPAVVISSLATLTGVVVPGDGSLLDRPIWDIEELSLPHDEDVLTFGVRALSFRAPSRNLYSHRLEGFDDHWSAPSTRSFVTYTDLRPGSYLLRVRGSNSDGVWNEAGASLRIRVAAPWWETVPFRSAVVLLSIAAVIGVFAIQRRVARRRQRLLEAEVADRTAELRHHQDTLEDTVRERTKDLVASREELRRSKSAIERSERKYRDLFDQSSALNAVVDERGVIVDVNRTFADALGYSVDELRGRRALDLVHADQQDLFRTRMPSILAGEVIPQTEWILIDREGRERPLTIAQGARPMVYDGAEQIGFVASFMDMTELRAVEDREREQREQLYQAAKLASLGTLVAGVAHEINNPNNFIRLSADNLSDLWHRTEAALSEACEGGPEANIGGLPLQRASELGESMLANIVDGSKRIDGLVRELREFATREAAAESAIVDLNDIVYRALVLVHPAIKRSTNNFSLVPAEHPALVRCTAQRLEQVVMNLVLNACDALTSRDDRITVTVRSDSLEQWAEVVVRDEGTGIPTNSLPHVTDPFFTTKRESGGTGLGLAVSFRIVTDHDGKLEFSSIEGQGTTAIVKLPLSDSVRSQ